MVVGPMIPLVLILVAVALIVLALRRRRQLRIRPVVVVAPVPRRRIRTDVPHLLYVYDWATGGDCYYGISNEPPARHRRHAVDPNDQWWYQRSTKVMHPLGWYPNRTAAFAAERAIVRKRSAEGADLANTVHNSRARRRRIRA
jgi:hypothetical protein